jgi:hypothetical protein
MACKICKTGPYTVAATFTVGALAGQELRKRFETFNEAKAYADRFHSREGYYVEIFLNRKAINPMAKLIESED